MNERSRIIIINAIAFIQEQTGYDYKEIATVTLGMTDKEYQEIENEFTEE